MMSDNHETLAVEDDEQSAYVTKPMNAWTDLDYAEALADKKIIFQDIPDEFRTSPVYQVAVTQHIEMYSWIPPERRDTDIQLKAIRAFPSLFLMSNLFNPTLCNDYQTLARAAVSFDAVNILALDIKYIDRRLVSEAIMTQPTVVYHLWQRSEDLCKELVDQAFVEEAVVDNLSCLFMPKTLDGRNYLAEFPLPDDVLIKAVKHQPKKAGLLAKLGRESLLSEMIKAGWWPAHWHDITKPNDLNGGISAFIQNKQYDLQRTYYKAYINQWPSSEVIPLMHNWPRKNYLPLLLPKEELFEVFKDDLKQIGEWFGQDLGL